jgi:hypothetical protein
MELPASTSTDAACRVTPLPTQLLFTCVALLADWSTITELAVTVTPVVTAIVAPPPTVRVAPLFTVRLLSWYVPGAQVVFALTTTSPD